MVGVALCCALFAGLACADFTYTTNYFGTTATITGYTGPGGVVVIPGDLDGKPVVAIGNGAFQNQISITDIIVPDGISQVGRDALAGCITLTNVLLGADITDISDGLFSGCVSLSHIQWTGAINQLGRGAFRNCKSLANMVIPPSVTQVLMDVFSGCEGLTNVVLHNAVTSIGANAFSHCTGLSEIIIPASVTAMGASSFWNCTGLTFIVVDDANPAFVSVDGVLYNKSQTTLILYPPARAGHYVFPETVTHIGDHAFMHVSGLTHLSIPAGMLSIGEGAFRNSPHLASVEVPSTATQIGANAFLGCTALNAIKVNALNPVYSDIDGVLFSKDLTELIRFPGARPGDPYVIPTGVTQVVAQAFSSSAGLRGVEFPSTIRHVQAAAFEGCVSLAEVDLPPGLTTIASALFFGCTALRRVRIPDTVTSIGQYAFLGCSSLPRIRIPGNVTAIGAGRGETFAQCGNLMGAYFEGARPSHGSRLFDESLDVIVYRLPDAAGWTNALYADRPVQIWLPTATMSGDEMQPGLALEIGAVWANGRQLILEAREQLNHGDWIPVATNTTANGLTTFSIPLNPDSPSRFFRLVP